LTAAAGRWLSISEAGVPLDRQASKDAPELPIRLEDEDAKARDQMLHRTGLGHYLIFDRVLEPSFRATDLGFTRDRHFCAQVGYSRLGCEASLRSGPGMTSSTVRVIIKSGAPVGAPLAARAEPPSD